MTEMKQETQKQKKNPVVSTKLPLLEGRTQEEKRYIFMFSRASNTWNTKTSWYSDFPWNKIFSTFKECASPTRDS